jgi:sulfoxide reductase catalytic subunit YedY
MHIITAPKFKSREITPKADWLNRRQLMAGAGAMAATTFGLPAVAKFKTSKSKYSTEQTPNTFDDITTYNNFYEFGTSKSEPAVYASRLTTSPWSVTIDGMVDKPGKYAFEDIIKGVSMEERIYRFRCVEAWSMIIPWTGFQLSELLNRVGVQSGAKYVSFETLVRPSEMVGQRTSSLEWPYREGLRMDEAMHPLTILAAGIYGEDMPKQNGAPLRLVVPWKYGFKSIKSIVRISLTDRQPQATWNMQNPREYGFYSNVNPNVDHPRWTQASERPIGGGLFTRRKQTQMFNGYEREVASLYKGMNLTRNF